MIEMSPAITAYSAAEAALSSAMNEIIISSHFFIFYYTIKNDQKIRQVIFGFNLKSHHIKKLYEFIEKNIYIILF